MGTYIPPEYLSILDHLPDLQKCANFFITFTPMFSYGTTCYGIYKKKTSMGFSIDICATMMMASILRICYYTISPFEISLLRQSIVMILIHALLLKISLSYRPINYNPDYLTPFPVFKHELNNYLPRRLSQSSNIQHEDDSSPVSDALQYIKSVAVVGFSQALRFFDVYYRRPGLFWQWLDEFHYWSFLVKFSVVFMVGTAIFHNNETYGNFMGILGLFIESLLPLPQILLLHRIKSIKNFKIVLLLSWLGGDCTKISYLIFGTDNISVIFIVAALFQMSLDIIIAFQYLHFRRLEFENLNLALPNTFTPTSIELDQFEIEKPVNFPSVQQDETSPKQNSTTTAKKLPQLPRTQPNIHLPRTDSHSRSRAYSQPRTQSYS